MKASMNLGKILGIPIGLNYSWFLVFTLLLFSLSSGYFPAEYPRLTTDAYVLMAAVTTILFFVSVLLHELGHSVIAIRNGISVKGITLFIFGGVAQIGSQPQTPGVEFRMAIAGPLTSLGLGALFAGIYWLAQPYTYLAAPSLYLMRINLTLALFNMIPGFPLDGGRVLRAIIWKVSASFGRATRVASICGQIVAFSFVGWGVYTIITGDFMNGLWLAFIGWFLQNAAVAEANYVNTYERLSGVSVAQAMSRDTAEVPALAPISQIVQEIVLGQGKHVFFVDGFDGQVQGLLTLQQITRIPQINWRFVTAGQIMTPIGQMCRFEAGEDLMKVMEKMDEEHIDEAPVIYHDRPVGLISRQQVQRYLHLKTKLGV
jgi:Zn-dependent protease